MRFQGVWLWITATGLFACGDAQVGSDYVGEPLMTLRGIVQSTEVLGTGRYVPGIRFESTLDRSVVHCEDDTLCPHMVYYVAGEVEGEFPSAFTLRLFEPPDADAIDEVVKGESPYTIGTLVAVSPQHPKYLRTTYTSVELADDKRDTIEEVCSDTDQCIKSSLFKTGCAPDTHFSLGHPYPCGAKLPDEYPWNLHGWSERHVVIYFVSDVPAGSVLSKVYNKGEALSAGYHVLGLRDDSKLSPEEVAEQNHCDASAGIEATEEVNRRFGTRYYADYARDTGNYQEFPEQHQVWQEALFRGQIARGCKQFVEVVDGREDPIELIFSDSPPFRAYH